MAHTIALIGNPNVGKTTLFNQLTGLTHSTGNYAGVTVERKIGDLPLNGTAARLVDLPGTYSLAAQSPDEMIVFDVLMDQREDEEPVDAVLAVIDATNIQRNLYLVSQIRDLGRPLVVALNMIDLAEGRKIDIDVEKLSEALGVPVVPISAHRGRGIDELKHVLAEVCANHTPPAGDGPEFPRELLDESRSLAEYLNRNGKPPARDVPWQEAFRILVDRGGYAEQRILKQRGHDFADRLSEGRERIGGQGSLAAVETRSRYAWIRDVASQAVRTPSDRTVTHTDRIDRILTHRVWGSLVFVIIMGLVFQSIYAWATPFMDMIDWFFGTVGGAIGSVVPEGPLRSLVVDGVIAGVGSVVIFLPQIIILSLFIALLEDCGYMARAAFLMDKLLSRVGLSGQSFIPLLSSFACAIPGIMATRTIPNTRDRLATMLVAPLMSCSARLPVYTIMIAAFIPATGLFGGFINLQGVTLFAMYALGVVVAIPVTFIVKKTLLKGATPPFILELPSYKMPQWKTVYRKVRMQTWMFLRRAGTVIFAITVVVWALSYFPRSEDITQQFATQKEVVQETMPPAEAEEEIQRLSALEQGAQVRNSIFGRMGQFIEPVFRPLGWDWRISVAALASFPAREVVVAVMGTLFNLGAEAEEDSLRQVLQTATWPNGAPLFNIPVALSLMVFFALCCQCGSTLAVMRRETGTWRWPVFTFTYMTVLAYVGALITYQVGIAISS